MTQAIDKKDGSTAKWISILSTVLSLLMITSLIAIAVLLSFLVPLGQ